MKIIRNTLVLSFILLIAVSNVSGQETPKLRDVDRVRLTEDRVAHWAASKYQPSSEFRNLKDFTTFPAVADQVREGIVRELSTLRLENYKRVAFYPLGAGEGLLLDRANPKWRSRYFAEKFDNRKYF